MTTVFAVLNPMNGSYTEVATEQERDQLVAETAWQFFLTHTHQAPYSVVTTNDDGSETWSAPNGVQQLNTEELKSRVVSWAAAQAQA